MKDPLDRIAEVCHMQPHDALSQIAAILGLDDAPTHAELTARIHELEAALRPFSDKHEAKADAIGDSDLDNEQPRSVYVTLGDFRRARRALNMRPTEQKEGKL